jgi:hypothetical protein
MSNREPVTTCTSGINAVLEVVLGNLDLLVGELVVVIGVEVERGNDVSQSSHVSLASRRIAGGVRWAHVGGIFADDVSNGHFVFDHLVDTLLVRDLVKVLVRPGVTSDLMSVGVHIRDDTCPILINGAFAQVVTSDEECRLGTASFELGHNLLSIDVWAIIVGDRDGLWLETFSDS